jgi:hypothetical protein
MTLADLRVEDRVCIRCGRRVYDGWVIYHDASMIQVDSQAAQLIGGYHWRTLCFRLNGEALVGAYTLHLEEDLPEHLETPAEMRAADERAYWKLLEKMEFRLTRAAEAGLGIQPSAMGQARLPYQD